MTNRGIAGRLLPVDARGKRAIEEVRADWRHETASATATGRRALRHVRGCLAFAVAFCLLLLRDLRAASRHPILGHLIAWIGLLAAVAWVRAVLVSDHFAQRLSFEVLETVRLSWTLQLLISYLPAATLLTFAYYRGRKPTPVIGFAAGAWIVMFVVAGWAQPAANFGNPAFFGTDFRGLARTPPTLSEAFAFESSLGFLRLASTSLATAASAVAYLLLGHQLARFGTGIRLFVAAAAGAGLVWIGYPSFFTPWVLGDLAVPFILPALALGAAVSLAACSPHSAGAHGLLDDTR